MRLLRGLLERLRPFRTGADVTEEVEEHLDALTRDAMDKGAPEAEARRQARLRLGSAPAAIAENAQQGDLGTMLEIWFKDFQFGLRSLRRSPVFAVTAILTLAVGIGANTLVFTLLYGLLLRRLPVPDPGSLVRLGVGRPEAKPADGLALPYRMLLQLRTQQRSFTGISAWVMRSIAFDAGDGAPRMLTAATVSGNAFEVLGLQAYGGRLITEADDIRGGPAEGWPAVLGYGFWKENFGGDPSAIGKRIRLANTNVIIVGVAPKGFRGVLPGSDTTIYLPLQVNTAISGRDNINPPDALFWTSAIARLKPGVPVESAVAELSTYSNALVREFLPPALLQERAYGPAAGLRAFPAPGGLPTFFANVYATPLYRMQGLVAVVLLICCVNIGGLMMSKVYARRQEFAVRTAIGAARWRLVRQYLTEGLLISLAGGVLGAAGAWYGTPYLLPFFRHPNEGVGVFVEPDTAILLATAFFAVLATLLFGALPAWRAGSADPGSLLKSRTSGGSGKNAAGRAFIPIQVALSFALVSLAALISQSLMQLETEQTGFDLDHVTIQTAPFHLLNLKPGERMDLYHRMKRRLNEAPGLTSASFTRFTPMTSFQAMSTFHGESQEAVRMAFNEVGPGYFKTMSIALIEGREFQDQERDASVCIVNQTAAAMLFPALRGAAIDQYVRGTGEREFKPPLACRVTGIARDAKFANLHEPPPPTLYLPVTESTLTQGGNLVFLLQARNKAEAIAAYRTAKSEISPATPYVLFVTLREQMDAALGGQRALSTMCTCFAVVALFLSGLGLYGLLSSSVAQRTSEIGVRMALGAGRNRVIGMIVREALVLVAAGLAFGTLLLLVSVKLVQGMLYGVSAWDPVRLVAVTGTLCAVAIAAALIPALRAASVDPVQALR